MKSHVIIYSTFHLFVRNISYVVSAAAAASNKTYIPAEIGICENVQTGRVRCAMKSSDCIPQQLNEESVITGEKWYSAYMQKSRGQEFCSCQETSIGSCNSRCSPQEHGYCDTTRNELFHEAMTITHNSGCRCDTAIYGACQDLSSSMNHFCAYSPTDCEEDHHHFWVEPSRTKAVTGLDCRCEQVRVGGCVGKVMGFACAISKDDCPWDVYYPPYSLKMRHGHTCNLCVSTGDGSWSPDPDELDSIQEQDNSKRGGTTKGRNKALPSVLVIFTVFGFGIAFFFAWKKKRGSGKRFSGVLADVSEEKSAPRPTEATNGEII
jgi:hypothetical protein